MNQMKNSISSSSCNGCITADEEHLFSKPGEPYHVRADAAGSILSCSLVAHLRSVNQLVRSHIPFQTERIRVVTSCGLVICREMLALAVIVVEIRNAFRKPQPLPSRHQGVPEEGALGIN